MASKRQHFAARRKAVGYSQERLAERLGVERSTVARWENGDSEPQPWIRPTLASALQISLERLDELLIERGRPESGESDQVDFALTHPADIDLVAVAHLRHQIQQLDQRYDRAPSTSLLAEAGQCLGRVNFFSAYSRGGRVRRELHAAEAEAATLMGQLVWDASQRRDHVCSNSGAPNMLSTNAERVPHDNCANCRASAVRLPTVRR